MSNTLGCFLALAFVWLPPAIAAADPLSAAPPRGAAASASAAAPAPSVVTLSAFMSYADLKAIGEAKIPTNLPVGGSGQAGCVKLIGKKICADYRWTADIRKTGPLEVGPGDGAIRVKMPVEVKGKAGLEGELAAMVKLEGRPFAATATPAADLTVELDSQWRPVVTASTLGRWVDDARVEISQRACLPFDLSLVGGRPPCLGPVNVNLASLIDEAMEHRRADIERAIANAVPAERIRARIAEVWRPISIKLPLAEAGPLYLDITPKSAAASRLTPGPDGVRLTARLGAETALAPAPLPADPLPLPPLEKAAPSDDRLQASLTLVAPYDVVKAQLAERLVGKDFKQTTSLGEVIVHVDDLDVYPSGAALAVGLKISAKAPTSALDASGWIYLTGRPVVADGGAGIRIADLAYSAALDNTFWQAAQSLLQGEIRSEIAARSQVDLSKRIDDAESHIVEGLAKADIKGVRLTASKPKITLANVEVAPTGLAVSAIVAMTLGVELTAGLVGR